MKAHIRRATISFCIEDNMNDEAIIEFCRAICKKVSNMDSHIYSVMLEELKEWNGQAFV